MKHQPRPELFLTLISVFVLFASNLWARDTLQIDKAFIGATDSWRDVTTFLQDQIQNDAVSFSISQPFKEIGGDPAPGQVKDLIVDYRVNDKPYRLFLKEEYPVAFKITVPSISADSPGADPEVNKLLENISSSSSHQTGVLRLHNAFVYGPICLSLAALTCAAVALGQVRRLKKIITRTEALGSDPGEPP